MFCLCSLCTFNKKSTSHNNQTKVDKYWSVEELLIKNAPVEVVVCGKQELFK